MKKENCLGGHPLFCDIDAVIFDLDGTLVDSMWMWHEIDVAFLGRYGIALPENLQGQIEGMSFSETALYFKERFQLPMSVEQMKADWNEMAAEKYRTEVPLKAGALRFLQELRDAGIKTGIATSNSEVLMREVLEALSLTELFTSVHTSCEVAHGKPEPDIYLHVARQLGIVPERCLVFEDIIPGIMAGKRAGMRVCAVADAYSAEQEAEKRALADAYIEAYTEFFSE